MKSAVTGFCHCRAANTASISIHGGSELILGGGVNLSTVVSEDVSQASRMLRCRDRRLVLESSRPSLFFGAGILVTVLNIGLEKDWCGQASSSSMRRSHATIEDEQ